MLEHRAGEIEGGKVFVIVRIAVQRQVLPGVPPGEGRVEPGKHPVGQRRWRYPAGRDTGGVEAVGQVAGEFVELVHGPAPRPVGPAGPAETAVEHQAATPHPPAPAHAGMGILEDSPGFADIEEVAAHDLPEVLAEPVRHGADFGGVFVEPPGHVEQGFVL